MVWFTVRMAIPKGSLEEDTFSFLRQSGINLYGASRSYRPKVDYKGLSVKILRPQEIPVLVQEGTYDLGISGQDWVRENRADVEELLDLEYGKVRLVLAAPLNSEVKSFDDLVELSERRPVRISTEYLNLASDWIFSKESYRELYDEPPTLITPWYRVEGNERFRLILSFGATEAKPPEDADAIIDNTATGTTLARNGLGIIEEICESSAVLIANKDSLRDPEKVEVIKDIYALFRGVVFARKNVHVFMNVREDNLQELISILPALKGPTISQLSTKGWYAVNTVIERRKLLELMPKLRRLAQGLVVTDPRQVLLLEDVDELVR